MGYPHNTRAPTNPYAPERTGICRRCGFYYPLAQLVEQWEWRGPSLGQILTRVCVRTCLDVPNEQLRTIIIGGDPAPIEDASPTFYDLQNATGASIASIGGSGGSIAPQSDDTLTLDGDPITQGGDDLTP